MRSGNTNVSLDDGLFYVPYDAMNAYASRKDPNDVRKKGEIPSGQEAEYELDVKTSQKNYDEWLERFRKDMSSRYRSLAPVDRYTSQTRHVVLESGMFQVVIEDNGWSFAVELISVKKSPHPGLQRTHFRSFFKGMRKVLMDSVGTIYARSGSWSVTEVTEETQDRIDERVKSSRIKIDPKAKPTTWVDLRKHPADTAGKKTEPAGADEPKGTNS